MGDLTKRQKVVLLLAPQSFTARLKCKYEKAKPHEGCLSSRPYPDQISSALGKPHSTSWSDLG